MIFKGHVAKLVKRNGLKIHHIRNNAGSTPVVPKKARVAKLVKAVGLDPATFAGSTPVLGIIPKS